MIEAIAVALYLLGMVYAREWVVENMNTSEAISWSLILLWPVTALLVVVLGAVEFIWSTRLPRARIKVLIASVISVPIISFCVWFALLG